GDDLVDLVDGRVGEPASSLRDAGTVEQPIDVVDEDALREAQVDVLPLRKDPREEGGSTAARQVEADHPPADPDSLRGVGDRATEDGPESIRDRAMRGGIPVQERLDGQALDRWLRDARHGLNYAARRRMG